MSRSGDDRAGWLPLLVLRPGDDGRLTISDPLHRRRGTVPAQDLLDHLAPTRADPPDTRRLVRRKALDAELADRGWFPAAPLAESQVESIQRWWQRGWHPSLSYYLWSRHSDFRDRTDSDGEVRKGMVRRYLDEGVPGPRRTAGGPPTMLAAPRQPQGGVGNLLLGRRTSRGYQEAAVELDRLATVLRMGLADLRSVRLLPRNNPLEWLSSHGTAFDFYVVNFRAQGLARGVHLYDLETESLSAVRLGDFREQMCRALIGMRAPETAAWTIVVVADFAQYQWRYRHERALRHLYMAAGRVAQRLIVVGESVGLGSLPTPAAADELLCDLLDIDPDRQAPVYTLTMGPVPERGAVR